HGGRPDVRPGSIALDEQHDRIVRNVELTARSHRDFLPLRRWCQFRVSHLRTSPLIKDVCGGLSPMSNAKVATTSRTGPRSCWCSTQSIQGRPGLEPSDLLLRHAVVRLDGDLFSI